MKIKNWEHAIDLTLQRHLIALERGDSYDYIKGFYMQVEGWEDDCPLCEYLNQRQILNEKQCSYFDECDSCLWLIFKGVSCSNSFVYNYCDNKQSIIRLNMWEELLTYLDAYPEMFKREA